MRGTNVQTLAQGRYRLLDELGSGGAARVFLAEDTGTGERCAVKVLHERGASENTRRRLRNEHRVMATLAHPHVLRVHAVRTDEQGREFFVMDYAPNGSLADRLDARGPMPTLEAASRMVEVLSALAFAHVEGVVHRDVKPQNILLGSDGRALLADFGIALLENATRATRAGARLGSVAFMAPEQRVDARSVGPAADIYAVGATLFHLLTGANPVDLFLAEPDSPRFYGIPQPLVDVIVRATRKDPTVRYGSASDMARAVESATAIVIHGDVRIADRPVTGSVRLPTQSGTVAAIASGDVTGAAAPEPRPPVDGATIDELLSNRALVLVAVTATAAGGVGAAVAWWFLGA